MITINIFFKKKNRTKNEARLFFSQFQAYNFFPQRICFSTIREILKYLQIYCTRLYDLYYFFVSYQVLYLVEKKFKDNCVISHIVVKIMTGLPQLHHSNTFLKKINCKSDKLAFHCITTMKAFEYINKPHCS